MLNHRVVISHSQSYCFYSSQGWMSGMEQWSVMASRTIRRLSIEEFMLWNYDVGEDSWESLRESLRVWSARRSNQSILNEISPWESPWEFDLQGDQTSLSQRKSVLKIHWKDWCLSWNSNTLGPYVKHWLIEKYSDAGKDWRQKEKRMTEDETVRWHHWLDRHEFEQAQGVGDGQGSLMCCNPCGHKESDTTEWLNNSYIFNFWETLYYFPKWLHQFTIPQQCMNIPFSLPHHQHIFFFFLIVAIKACILNVVLGFPCGSAAQNLPAMKETQEMRVWYLSQEYLLEEEMTPCSSIRAHTVGLIFTFLVINNVEWFFI